MAKRESMRGKGVTALFSQATPPMSEEPANQQDSEPANQLNSMPVNGQELVKATFYLTSEHILKLEQLRLARKQRGEKRVDKSALVREAIERLD